MPPLNWPSEPSNIIAAFEARHTAPEAGALFIWAVSAVDALHYLADVDASYDVAHARWAAGTSMTALDLCAAALGRAICKHPGPNELNLGSFDASRSSQRAQALLGKLPNAAAQWLNSVLADPRFVDLKAARDALTHRRLPRHFFASVGSPGPDKRLELQVGAKQVRIADLVIEVRDLATTHVAALIHLLPSL
jgi:hypothetical protein